MRISVNVSHRLGMTNERVSKFENTTVETKQQKRLKNQTASLTRNTVSEVLAFVSPETGNKKRE